MFKTENMVRLAAGTMLLGVGRDNFRGKVLFVAEHGVEGTVAFVLNDPTTIELNELLPELPAATIAIHQGGPVSLDALHMLHVQHEFGGRQTGPVKWGADFKLFKTCVKNGAYNPAKMKLFVGYSGWSTGKLQEHIDKGHFLVVAADQEAILDSHNPFGRLLHAAGEHASLMYNAPLDPQLN